MDSESPPITLDQLEEINEVAGRAKAGDASALPRLRELLDDHPEMWRQMGDMASHARRLWVNLAAGDDLQLRECLLRRVSALIEELAGVGAQPAVRLAAERAAVTWLVCNYYDAAEPPVVRSTLSPSLKVGKRQQQAHRDHLAALKALAELRRLLPAKGAAPAAKPKPEVIGNRIAGYFEGLDGRLRHAGAEAVAAN